MTLQVLRINVPGRATQLDFRFFDASRAHINGILTGTTYPVVPEVGTVSTVLDIGANVGATSVMFVTRYPTAVIHAFEPGNVPHALLVENVRPFPNVAVYPVGLHDTDRDARLYRSRWDPMSASIGTSAENTDACDDVSIRRASTMLESLGVTSAEVIKIDTEGCEYAILNDLGRIRRESKLIYLEFHSEADRRQIDALVEPTHILASAVVRHPHRGELCYVSRNTDFVRRMNALAISIRETSG